MNGSIQVVTRRMQRDATSPHFLFPNKFRKAHAKNRALTGMAHPKKSGMLMGAPRIFDNSVAPKKWQPAREPKQLPTRPPVIEGQAAIFRDGTRYNIALSGQYVRTK